MVMAILVMVNSGPVISGLVISGPVISGLVISGPVISGLVNSGHGQFWSILVMVMTVPFISFLFCFVSLMSPISY
jgi:hypothetical protein